MSVEVGESVVDNALVHSSSVRGSLADSVLVDSGLLTAYNHDPVEAVNTRSLKELATGTTQCLINAIFSLPPKSTGETTVALLPAPATLLPRAQILPKLKAETKWAQFAREKGIHKVKKSRMELDEATGEMRPSWGYGSKKNDDMADWLIEIPESADQTDDFHAKLTTEKKDRIAKNKKQQLKNIERANPNLTIKPVVSNSKKAELEEKIKTTKVSTASLGKFDKKLINEPKMKRGVKRKVAIFN